jgi:hypothetical protein
MDGGVQGVRRRTAVRVANSLVHLEQLQLGLSRTRSILDASRALFNGIAHEEAVLPRDAASCLEPRGPAAVPSLAERDLPVSNTLDDPERWRSRAAEVRALAESMSDAQARRVMHDIAESYEYLARRAEERAAKQKP